MTEIFHNLETRGEDAAGFWATQKGKKGAIFYHKEPIKSSEMVATETWKKMNKFNPNLMVLHARAASPGVGIPSINKNNHPFVSEDKTLSIVHNGKLPEYHYLKEKYDTQTNCDSELILRLLQSKSQMDILALPQSVKDNDKLSEYQKNRLSGIHQLWSLSYYAHMACAVGEWFSGGSRQLWLWRNEHRPLWIADLRETLGQIMFFSEDKIWSNAVSNCPGVTNYINKNQRMYELPTEEIWFFEINSKKGVVSKNGFHKFYIVKKGTETVKEDDIPKGDLLLENKTGPSKLICDLDENEEPLNKTVTKTSTTYKSYSQTSTSTSKSTTSTSKSTNKWGVGDDYDSDSDSDSDDNNNRTARNQSLLDGTHGMHKVNPIEAVVSRIDVEELCDEIKTIISNLKTEVYNRTLQGDVDSSNLMELYEQLESSKIDLQATLQILDSSKGS